MNPIVLLATLRDHKIWLTSNGKRGGRADFTGLNLGAMNFDNANLEGACFKGASACFTSFEGANMRHTNCEGVNFYRANISGVDFSGASLKGAKLVHAHTTGRKCSGFRVPPPPPDIVPGCMYRHLEAKMGYLCIYEGSTGMVLTVDPEPELHRYSMLHDDGRVFYHELHEGYSLEKIE
jgi:uncharacterized protein YjbI with pentapeptide repeats